MDATMQADSGFSVRYYFVVLSKILGTPNSFFKELSDATGFKQSMGFLVVSAIFSSAALLMTQPLENVLLAGGIYFVNAVGMTVIAAGLGYIIVTMFAGPKVPLRRIFGVYAFASGVALLASWIPLFIWITEPWKWILIGMGLAKNCGFGWPFSILVILISITVIVLFFWSLLPVMSSAM